MFSCPFLFQHWKSNTLPADWHTLRSDQPAFSLLVDASASHPLFNRQLPYQHTRVTSELPAMMQGPSDLDEVPLDVRLRNLILQNAATAQQQQGSSLVGAPAQNTSTVIQPNSTQNSRQKRPNQAQRRQMSAQMTIPIDHRSAQPHDSRSYGSPAGPGPPFRQHPQHGSHYPHHAAFQNAHVNSGISRGGPYQPDNRHHPSPSYPGSSPAPVLYDWRQPSGAQNSLSGNQYGPRSNHGGRNPTGQGSSAYNPQAYPPRQDNNLEAQVALLEQLSQEILANAEIDLGQIEEKERFRLLIEDACRVAIDQHEREDNGRHDFPAMSVQLQCFGSLAAGFATKSSDMDLGLLSPLSHPQPDAPESQIPRIVEKVFLEMGLGARLLSKTRVPIIKVCQKPPEKLFSDLLEERAKWERGEDEDNDNDFDEDEAASGRPESPIDQHQPSEKALPVYDDDQGNDQYQALLKGLRQGSKSLGTYHSAAKKLLRKLGGRDISNSTASTFTPEDYRILNDLCGAFVRGLADDSLRTRLQSYESLAFGAAAPLALNRSLFGVMAQIEGESIVMTYESRSIRENIALSESALEKRITQWIHLQNSPAHKDPLTYNKEIQLASDAIKKFPSVAVLLLEQGQYETASSYHSRAVRLLIDLGGHDGPVSQSKILPVVLQQYTSGIYDFEIRSQVSDFLHSSTTHLRLSAVARRHKSLQLAKEFEKALEKDVYPVEKVNDIRRYVEMLRGPMELATGEGADFDSALVTSPDTWSLVAKIRELQDPARTSPNQPRDRYRDKLEFPKSDIGVQCDINFSAQLALQNTHLLRCYSLTDPRVRPLVLFVKHWAKIRGINTPYRGTLSSYGYVLMVLHYLTNVARPYVCPNLQLMAPAVPPNLTAQQIESAVYCKGRDVRFWRDEEQIKAAVLRREMNSNIDSIGYLLRGFFEYYAQSSMMSTYQTRGFDWGRDVLSIRSPNGLLSKQEKGWTGAKTVLEVRGSDKPSPTELMSQQPKPAATPVQNNATASGPSQSLPSAEAIPATKKSEVKEVRHRYLFAIEDPFELDHNVARTVTHQGIVAIRDEFRRAWRIIRSAGKAGPQETLLQDASTEKQAENNKSFLELLDDIHGRMRV